MPTSTEPDVLVEFEKLLTEREAKLEGRFTSIEDRFQSLAQKTSRPPVNLGSRGTGGPLETTDAAAHLSNERSFRDWLAGSKGQRSAITFTTPYTFERKDATPLLNVGGAVNYPAIYGPPPLALRLVQLMPNIPVISGSSVEYTRETSFIPNANSVAEGDLKPQSSVSFVSANAPVLTIANFLKVSLQSLADTPGLQTWLDRRVGYAVMLKAESIFLGDLLSAADTLAESFTPAGESVTQLDLIASAIAQLEAAGYTPDGVVLAGPDAAKARLLKTTSGEYLWASPDATVGTSGMWSVPVVISPSMPAGNWLVGAFGQSTILFARQSLTVEIAFQNEDDFVKNLATVRAEERAGLAVPLPGGLIKGTFPAPPPG